MANSFSNIARRSDRRAVFAVALFLLLLPAGTSSAAANGCQLKAPPGNQEKEKQSPAVVASPAKPDDSEAPTAAALAEIEELRVLPKQFESIFPRKGSKPLVEIVNVFSVRTRGRYYGSVYEYHRNDFFDARNFFDPVGKKLPEYKRNQFGAGLGVFVTSRLQIFGTYDGLRINKGSTMTSLVPEPEMRAGDFSSIEGAIVDPRTGDPFPGNRIPHDRLHPVALKMLPTIPEPNRSDMYPYFTNNQPAVENGNTISIRADYEFSRQSKLFGNWRFTDGGEFKVNRLPEFSTSEKNRYQNFSLTYNRSFGPSLVMNLKATFDRRVENEFSRHAFKEGLLDSLGIHGVHTLDSSDEGYPEVSISGYPSLGQSYRNQSPRSSYTNTAGFAASFTRVRKAHKFNIGLEVRNQQLNNYRAGGSHRGHFEFYGDFTGHAFADFLLGIPAVATRGMGFDRADLRQRTWKAYFRDDWKISPRFSLSLGLAYDYFPVAHSIHDNVSLFWPLVFEPPADGGLVVAGSPEAEAAGLRGLRPGHAAYPDRNDWQPSFGLAYSPMGNNKLVLRASYGWNYQPLDMRRTLNFIGRNYPFYWQEAASSPSAPELDLSDPFRAAAPAEMTVRAVDPYVRSSYVQEWQLSVQNEFMRGWTFEARYDGRKATRMGRTIPANVPVPGEGSIQERRPNPRFGKFSIGESGGSSIGHALRAELRKRLSGGFSLRSNFDWDRTFSDSLMSDPQDPRNLRAERALSGFSPPMRFSVSYIWELPVGRERPLSVEWAGKFRALLEGWQLSGITRISSGTPTHPQLRGDKNNDGVSGDRPDRIGPGVLPPSARSAARWFATEDFAAPADIYSFGNCGRNVLFIPGEMVWDVSLIKRTRLSARGAALEFRVQMFNAFNHTNFERPGTSFGTSTFGVITNAKASREIEIALKYMF